MIMFLDTETAGMRSTAIEYDFPSIFRVDFESGKVFWIKPPKNHAELTGCEAGYICVGKGKNKSYWQLRAFGKTFKRSRVIFFMANGKWPTPSVDHINGQSLDDRLSNLRECTHSQNSVNSQDKKRRYDLPRGVYPTRQGKFMARLTVGGVAKSIGVFPTPGMAHFAYQNARKEAFGDFA